MRYVGIDIAAKEHVVAVVDEAGQALVAPTRFAEDAQGYDQLRTVLGNPSDLRIVLEATGHYWQNLAAFLVAQGHAVAVVNPSRTARFAKEDLQRTKTDALDARTLARFGAQKQVGATRVPEEALRDLKELVRFREQLGQRQTDMRLRLHRLVHLSFPEFTHVFPDLGIELAQAVLGKYPTAQAVAQAPRGKLARVQAGPRQPRLGPERATQLLGLAKQSVGAHQSEPYAL